MYELSDLGFDMRVDGDEVVWDTHLGSVTMDYDDVTLLIRHLTFMREQLGAEDDSYYNDDFGDSDVMFDTFPDDDDFF